MKFYFISIIFFFYYIKLISTHVLAKEIVTMHAICKCKCNDTIKYKILTITKYLHYNF